MRRETRLAFNGYLAQLARLNGVDLATESFSVAPAVQQKLVQLIQASSAFLQKIAFETVVNQEGDKVGVGVTRPLAGRVKPIDAQTSFSTHHGSPSRITMRTSAWSKWRGMSAFMT